MQVTVKLFATFRQGRFSTELREYEEGTRVAAVISELELPDGAVGTILINSRQANRETELKPGDQLALFPHLSGG